MDCGLPRLLCAWDSPGKNTGVGCHAFLQGIFLTQRLDLCLLRLLLCRQVLYCWATREDTSIYLSIGFLGGTSETYIYIYMNICVYRYRYREWPGKSLKPFPSSLLSQKRLRFCPKKLINTSYKSINHLEHLSVTDNFLQVKRFLNIILSCKLWIKSIRSVQIQNAVYMKNTNWRKRWG